MASRTTPGSWFFATYTETADVATHWLATISTEQSQRANYFSFQWVNSSSEHCRERTVILFIYGNTNVFINSDKYINFANIAI